MHSFGYFLKQLRPSGPIGYRTERLLMCNCTLRPHSVFGSDSWRRPSVSRTDYKTWRRRRSPPGLGGQAAWSLSDSRRSPHSHGAASRRRQKQPTPRRCTPRRATARRRRAVIETSAAGAATVSKWPRPVRAAVIVRNCMARLRSRGREEYFL